MLEPLAVDPNRSVAPAANSMASARLVFPAPAGPTSAITRVPFDSPAMRLSLRAIRARESLSRRRSGAYVGCFTVRLFSAVCKGGCFASGWNGDPPTAVYKGREGEGLGCGKQPPLAGEAQQCGLQLLERAHLDLPDALT